MIELIDKNNLWKPTTSGERLLFMLLRDHQEWQVLADALKTADLRLGRRYHNLSNFFVGASVLHLQQRLIKLAHDVRNEDVERWQAAKELRNRACDIIQLTPIEYRGDFGMLIEEVLTSAEQMCKEPTPALRKRVIVEGPKACYSCGRVFGEICEDGPAPEGLKATADHIWPRALGGDTIKDNLLPACASCNSLKGHLAAWQMAWIQPVVFSDTDEANGLKSLQREVKMALHTRAAMAYAQKNGSTLRDAFLAIGPREPPTRIDPDQGYDFFNLRVHDEPSTGINWTPY